VAEAREYKDASFILNDAMYIFIEQSVYFSYFILAHETADPLAFVGTEKLSVECRQ